MAAVRHRGFSKVRNFNWSGSEGQYASSCQMLCRSVKPLPRYRNFYFLGCRPPPFWISSNFKFVMDQTVTRTELRHPTKHFWNGWNCGRDMAIFRFFQMAAAAMLEFWNYKFLTVGRVISVKLRHNAKFRINRSNRCQDISIFDFSRWWQPPCCIFEVLKFIMIGTVKKDGLRHCAKFCRNRSNHGGDMSVFEFPRWRRRPSWIFEISNF